MQNEKDYPNLCKKFEYYQDFVEVFWKSDDALLKYEVLDNNVCLYGIDYTIFSSIKNLHIPKNIIINFNRVFNSLRLL